jgi:hypothetical protein
MRRHRGRRRSRKESKKKESLQEVSDDLNSIFGPSTPEKKKEPEIVHTEVFRLTEEEKKEILENVDRDKNFYKLLEKKPKTKAGKIFNFIKRHVRPDIGIGPFKEGEGPDFKNDDLYEIGDKLRENLRVGLKLTIKF